jgi:uncharacterized protein (DUF2384 family)
MATNISTPAVPGYRFDTPPDIRDLATRERLSQSAVDGFFAIMERWRIPQTIQTELLGGISRSKLNTMKTSAGTLSIDQLFRVSYIVGIYKALHILLNDELADQWMTRPNDDFLFQGDAPLNLVLSRGLIGLATVRNLLDAARGGK